MRFWVWLGKPEDIMEDLAMVVNTAKKVFPGTENENRNETKEEPKISFNSNLQGEGGNLTPPPSWLSLSNSRTVKAVTLEFCSIQ